MNGDLTEKVRQLVAQARGLGNTPEAVAVLEEAVRLADSHEDAPLGYRARQELIRTATFSGSHDKMLVAFSWCLAEADRHPDRYSDRELLWKYKWVIEKLVLFPAIPRAKIMAALDDLERRCRKAAFSDRTVFGLHCSIEMQLGDPVAAKAWLMKWQTAPRDGISDCEACEINRMAELHAILEDHETAIRTVRPILEGRLRCTEIPHITYAVLLRSLWLVQGPEEAALIHAKGYRLVQGNRDFVREQGWHIQHLLRADQLDEAMALVRRHLIWALETQSLDYQLYFLLAARAGVRRLIGRGDESVQLRVPEKLCPVAGGPIVRLEPFAEWLEGRITKLAADFDRRNGNDWFAQFAARIDAECKA
jgi:hypothetical protein